MSSLAGRRGPLAVLAIGFALMGAHAIRAVVAASPAFAPDLRVEAPAGGWRAETGTAHYYPTLYLREQAAAWLSKARAENDAAAAGRAAAYARASLAMAPLNPFAWHVLAWAELQQGNLREARRALMASWRAAPFSADLAEPRLRLALTLGLVADPDARVPIMNDVRVARREARMAYAALAAAYPVLAVFERLIAEADAAREAGT